MFSDEYVRATALSAVFSILVPLAVLVYYRAKSGKNEQGRSNIRLSSFFIGMGFYFIFCFLINSLLNTLFLSVWGIYNLLEDHEIRLTLFYSISTSLCAIIGIYAGLKWILRKPGPIQGEITYNHSDRQNAFVFGLGAGGLDSILLGGIVNITTLVMALFVNGLGSDAYLEKLQTSEDTIETEIELLEQSASIPASSIYTNTLMRFLLMCLYVSMTVLIYQAITNKDSARYCLIAFVISVIGYMIINLTEAGIISNSIIAIALMTIFVFFTGLFAWYIYHTSDNTL